MPLPRTLKDHPRSTKLLIAAAIALTAIVAALALRLTPVVSAPAQRLDNLLYDWLYHQRPIESARAQEVVIVAVDQRSLKEVNDKLGYGWPWPRQYWAQIARFADAGGARALAIDLLFTERSLYSKGGPDDDLMAEAMAEVSMPVIYGALAGRDGRFSAFAPPVIDPVFGATNVTAEGVIRTYDPSVHGLPSLALRTVTAIGARTDVPDRPFRLHYYGPHIAADGAYTFGYLSAVDVLGSAQRAASSATTPDDIPADVFKGKIVLLGIIAAGGSDVKITPLSEQFPGTEIQATAVLNLMQRAVVTPVNWPLTALAGFVGALLAAAGGMLPRRVSLKLLGGVVAFAALVVAALLLFGRADIVWLPLAAPLLAVVLAAVGAMAWSYLSEDRQRRVVLKALGQYVSPAVADAIAKNPDTLKLGGERREMSVMFTDIAGFTDLSETLDVQRLSTLLNFYLDEMSSVVLEHDGTLDKYVGDAIMSFWNAPLIQEDHAVRACRAALGMQAREEAIQPRLRELGAARLFTRIGINSGPMSVGNMGSTRKFNYTVLGDSVNLGSRLEGANKFYGTRIMIAESTAALVKDQFILRRLDSLRVKGKLHPMAVYELLCESGADEKLRQLAQRYEAAFVQYQNRQWDAAESALRALLVDFPDDGPARTLMERIAHFRHEPPGADWDGVYVAKSK